MIIIGKEVPDNHELIEELENAKKKIKEYEDTVSKLAAEHHEEKPKVEESDLLKGEYAKLKEEHSQLREKFGLTTSQAEALKNKLEDDIADLKKTISSFESEKEKMQKNYQDRIDGVSKQLAAEKELSTQAKQENDKLKGIEEKLILKISELEGIRSAHETCKLQLSSAESERDAAKAELENAAKREKQIDDDLLSERNAHESTKKKLEEMQEKSEKLDEDCKKAVFAKGKVEHEKKSVEKKHESYVLEANGVKEKLQIAEKDLADSLGNLSSSEKKVADLEEEKANLLKALAEKKNADEPLIEKSAKPTPEDDEAILMHASKHKEHTEEESKEEDDKLTQLREMLAAKEQELTDA